MSISGNRGLTGSLARSGENGLSTYLIGDCEYQEIISTTEVENLFFVPAGPVPPNPSELLDTDRMKRVHEEGIR